MNTLPVCIKLKYDSLWEQIRFKSIYVSACIKLSDNLVYPRQDHQRSKKESMIYYI